MIQTQTQTPITLLQMHPTSIVASNEPTTKKKSAKHREKENKYSVQEKNALWNVFDTEVPNDKTVPLECVYRNTGDRENCELCSNMLAFSEEGFLTCTNSKCGVIYKDLVDQGAEWRFYGADDNQNSNPTRCGMPTNPYLEESSYGCKVLCYGAVSYEMHKIRRYTDWQMVPYSEKSRYEEFQRITTIAQINGIPKLIIDGAIRYHKKISEFDRSFRGDNRDGLLLASIYVSCRVNNYPRTAKELAEMFQLDVTSATKGCKMAQVILNQLEQDLDMKEKTAFCKTTPDAFIERYCSKLNINAELTRLAHFVASKIEKQGLMPENTPHSIAAGVIFFVAQTCHLNVSKFDVKNVSEISEVTINKCYKKMDKMREELIPRVILDKYGY
jgi:transcription initiation factor TFIIB